MRSTMVIFNSSPQTRSTTPVTKCPVAIKYALSGFTGSKITTGIRNIASVAYGLSDSVPQGAVFQFRLPTNDALIE
jgi:hypothetical protein